VKDGAAAAAGFYLGITDDVTPKLRKLRREYTAFISDILAGNAKVQKSIGQSKALARESALAQMGGAMAAPAAASAPLKQRFQLSLEPKRGVGLLRRLFPSAREHLQKFMGKLVPLAKGGMVKDPTAALIGEGGEPELVIPLSKMQGFFARTLSKAITDAGKMTGAAGDSLGKASNVRDIVVAFTDSEERLRNMVKFIGDGMKMGRTSAQDAHRMAVIVAKMRQDEFGSSIEKARFVKTLKDRLVPAVEKMRKQSGDMHAIFKKNDELLKSQRDNAAQLGILMTAALHNLDRGFSAADKLIGAYSSKEAAKVMMQVGGLNRSQVAQSRNEFATMSDRLVSSLDFEEVSAGFAKAGMRKDALIEFTKAHGRSITLLAEARDADIGKTAALHFHLRDRIRLSADAVDNLTGNVGALAGANNITADALLDTAEGSLPLLQGVFSSLAPEVKKGFLDSTLAAKSAFSDRFVDFDVNSLLMTLATDMQSRALLGNIVGMSEGALTDALKSGDFATFLPQIVGDIQTGLSGKKGPQLQAAFDVLQKRYGNVLSAFDVATLSAIANEGDAINAKFLQNQLIVKDAAGVMDDLALSAESALGYIGQAKNLAMFGADYLGLKNVVSFINELDLIGLAQGVLGVSMSLTGVGTVLGKFFPSLSRLMAAIPLVGRMFTTTAATTVAASAKMGTGVGLSLSRVGMSVGVFLKSVGGGVGTAIRGVLAGLGTGLLALAPGLAALSAPPVLIGIAAAAVALVALGGAVWMLGKGLGAAAPFIEKALTGLVGLFLTFKPVLEGVAAVVVAAAQGIANVIDTTLVGITGTVITLVTTFSGLDAVNLLAVGPGLAAVGVGFTALGIGLSAGLAALTAGNLADKLSNLFGLSAGTGVLAAIGQLTAYLGPLSSAFTKLSTLPAVITLPQIRAAEAYPVEVLSETMRALPNLREATLHAQYAQQSVGSDDEMKDLMRMMLAALQTIASNGKSRPGGIAGELVSGGAS
jgi:hypothetical protein